MKSDGEVVKVIFEALILGIIVGKLRGGQFKRLGYQTLRFPLILILAFLLLLGTSTLITLGYEKVIAFRMYLYILGYCFLFLVLFLNLHIRSVWFILIGAICNFAAITLNNGSMPIDLLVLEKMGFANLLKSIEIGSLPNFISINEAYSYTQYLAKRFSTPVLYPIKQIFSIGDALIAAGLFLYVQRIMQSKLYRKMSKVIHFDHKGRMGA